MFGRLFVCFSITYILSAVPIFASNGTELRLEREVTSVFPGDAANWQVELYDGDAGYSGSLSWIASFRGGTTVRREQAVRLTAGEPLLIDIETRIPEPRRGVAGEGFISFTLLDQRREKVVQKTQPIFIFIPDIVSQRRGWFDLLNLRLFDPEGKTASSLDGLNWPYQATDSITDLELPEDGVLLIGEDIKLSDYPDASGTLFATAAKGGRIIVMAQREGRLALPPSPPDSTAPSSVLFQGIDIVNEIDRRLEFPQLRSGMEVVSAEDAPEMLFRNKEGWPFVAMRWPNGGRLLFVGFDMLDEWESSPVPRYLLAGLIEWVLN